MMACLLSHITALEANFFWRKAKSLCIVRFNNAPHASPRCAPWGVTFCGSGNEPNLIDAPAMPLNEAHFGGFFCFRILPISLLGQHLNEAHWICALWWITITYALRNPVGFRRIAGNNTPQAYPVVRCSDAQTGGLLIYGGCYAL